MAQNNKLPKNIIKTIDDNNTIQYRYYSTDILTINFDPSKNNSNYISSIIFKTDGHYTKSTARHIKNLAAKHGIAVNIIFRTNYYVIIYKGVEYPFEMNSDSATINF